MASIWNRTSMRGSPAGIGGMPRSLKRASDRQSAASSRSPCSTWTSTAVWLSTPVVNISRPLAGIVELRRMIFDVTPPIVSMPSDSGVTSSSSISRRPLMRMSACTAAPSATTSSGLRSLCGVRPNSSSTRRRPAARASSRRPAPPRRSAAARGRRRRAPAARGQRALDERRDQPLELRTRDAPPIARRQARRRLDADLGGIGRPRDPTWPESRPCGSPGWSPIGRVADRPAVRSSASTSPEQRQVDVVAAEVRVAAGREHLEDAVLDLAGSRCRTCRRRGRRRRSCRGSRSSRP